MASNFVVSCRSCDRILSFNIVLLMNLVALFYILWILCLFVDAVLFVCIMGNSRISLIRALYMFHFFIGAVINLYDLLIFILAFWGVCFYM